MASTLAIFSYISEFHFESENTLMADFRTLNFHRYAAKRSASLAEIIFRYVWKRRLLRIASILRNVNVLLASHCMYLLNMASVGKSFLKAFTARFTPKMILLLYLSGTATKLIFKLI